MSTSFIKLSSLFRCMMHNWKLLQNEHMGMSVVNVREQQEMKLNNFCNYSFQVVNFQSFIYVNASWPYYFVQLN